MARTINEEEHEAKRNEILDEVQKLIYTKGYEQMTIRDIIDGLQMSKGAFYHYYDSKQALLTALLERIQQQMMVMLTPLVEDENLSALEKLRLYFTSIGQWKTARRSFLMEILRVWYHDNNAIVRQKLFLTISNPVANLLTGIIYQGIEEGTLKPVHPDHVAKILFRIVQDLADTVALRLLEFDPEHDELQPLIETVNAYNHSVEMVLGAPEGSIPLFSEDLLRQWFYPEDGG